MNQLQVAWKEPLAPGGTTPLRTARGKISVRVDETQVITTAELTLTDLRGKAKEWRMWLPAQAKLSLVSPQGLAAEISLLAPYQHILTLASSTSEPIKVAVTVTSTRLGNAKIPVGPFAVYDAVRQDGTIEVKLPAEARRRLRLTFNLTSYVVERDPPRDSAANDVVAVFQYSSMPTPMLSATPAAKLLVPPLEIEPRTIQGKVETQVEHDLRLRQGPQGLHIAATCKITARPQDVPVDYLDVQLPRLPGEALPLLLEPRAAGFPGGVPWAAWAVASQVAVDGEWILANPSAAVELQYPDTAARAQRKVRIKWAQAQAKEFTITLKGRYALPAGLQKVRLELPRPVGIQDFGAKALMEVGPALELLTQDPGPDLAVPEKQKHVLTRTWERAPISWDLAWRAFQPEFPVMATADVTFWPGHAHVKLQWTFDQADRPRQAGQPAPLRLRLPPEAKNLRVVSGGKLTALERQQAAIDAPERPGKNAVVLEYDFALPTLADAVTPIQVPLIWPEQATRVETKARLWSQPEIKPVLAEASALDLMWKDVGTEVVPGQGSLPSSVLLAEGQYLPLVLRLQKSPAPLVSVVIDRLLMVADVEEDGTEHYHARFLLTKLHTTSLDVRMPLPNLDPKFLLDGKLIPWTAKDSSGLIARLSIDPSLYDKPAVLAVDYRMATDQPRPEGIWQTTLDPPVLEGNVLLGKVRWQVTLPGSMLAVAARRRYHGAFCALAWLVAVLGTGDFSRRPGAMAGGRRFGGAGQGGKRGEQHQLIGAFTRFQGAAFLVVFAVLRRCVAAGPGLMVFPDLGGGLVSRGGGRPGKLVGARVAVAGVGAGIAIWGRPRWGGADGHAGLPLAASRALSTATRIHARFHESQKRFFVASGEHDPARPRTVDHRRAAVEGFELDVLGRAVKPDLQYS